MLAGLYDLLIFLGLRILLFNFRSLIAKLAEALNQLLGGRLLTIVSNGHHLLGNVALNLFDTLLETKVALDFILAAFAMHLGNCGDN